MTRWFVTVIGFVVFASLLTIGMAHTSPAAQTPAPQIEAAPYKATLSVEGKDSFVAYCAVCHGKDAKGHGPAAPAMKALVPDLTTIAKRHNNKFDAAEISYILKGTGRIATPAHGVEEMPIWGDAFRSEDTAKATLRVTNLVKYLETIQQPPASR